MGDRSRGGARDWGDAGENSPVDTYWGSGRDPAILNAARRGLDDPLADPADVQAVGVSQTGVSVWKTSWGTEDSVRLDNTEAVQSATTEEVVAELVVLRRRIEALREAEYLVSRQIIETMEADGSERMRTPTGIVTLPRSVTYDASILAGLREITDPADLDGIYYPEHEEVKRVPEAWNMSKGRKLLKHSADHASIIEDAKIYGSPRVKIEKEAM